jgi:hypothetical protein
MHPVNATFLSAQQKVARVAVDVRLYFDVTIATEDESEIQRAAHTELERVADEDRIRVKHLHHATIYPKDDWPALKPSDFSICDICPASEVSSDSRFSL